MESTPPVALIIGLLAVLLIGVVVGVSLGTIQGVLAAAFVVSAWMFSVFLFVGTSRRAN